MSLSLRKINLYDKDGLQAAIDKAVDTDGEHKFLCHKGSKLFVSYVHLLDNPDRTMPVNCEKGCLYVDSGSMVIPINNLAELYYIVGGD